MTFYYLKFAKSLVDKGSKPTVQGEESRKQLAHAVKPDESI